MAVVTGPRSPYLAETAAILRLAVAFALGLLLAAGSGVVLYHWPWQAGIAGYLAVFVWISARHVMRVLRPGLSTRSLGEFVSDLMVHNLHAPSAWYRARERGAAILFLVAQTVFWPKLMVLQLLVPRWLRRLRERSAAPSPPSQVLLAIGPFAINMALFLALPTGVLALTAGGLAHAPMTALAVGILATNLFCRHIGMLVFPHDPKEVMRQTPADPRALIFAFLAVDTFAFAAVIYALEVRSGIGRVELAAIFQTALDLLTAKAFREVGGALTSAIDAGWHELPGRIAVVLRDLSVLEGIRLACSTVLYWNLLQALFPLRSWQRTDDDFRAIAQMYLVAGMPARAEQALEKVRRYDSRTAELEGLARAMVGDFTGASTKLAFAHRAQDLPSDPDLVFLNTMPASLLARSKSFESAPGLEFALRSQVSDAVLALMLLVVAASEGNDPDRLLARLSASGLAPQYPLSRLCLARASGESLPAEELDAVRESLEARVLGDPATHAAALVFGLMGGDEWWLRAVPCASDAAAVRVEAERLLAGLEPQRLSVSRAWTTMEFVSTLRRGLAAHGERTEVIDAHYERIMGALRRAHPALRDKVAYQVRLHDLLNRHN